MYKINRRGGAKNRSLGQTQPCGYDRLRGRALRLERLGGRAPRLGLTRGSGIAATWSNISVCYIWDPCTKLIGGGRSKNRILGNYPLIYKYLRLNQWNIRVIGNYYVNYENCQNLMLLTSSDTKRTLMHLFVFTNSAQRELVSICTQSIHDRNKLSLHYILGLY